MELLPLSTPPLLALLASIFLHALARRMFPVVGLLDFPERYGLTRARLPYPTGIIAVALFLIFFPLLQDVDRSAIGVIGAVCLLGITACIDDRRPLPPVLRLGIQALAAWSIFFLGDCTGGRICSVTNPLEGLVGGAFLELNGTVPIVSVIVTIFWLMLTTNALNWFDGIPGQTSVLSAIGFATVGVLSLSDRVQQPDLALLAFVLAALAAGGAVFELPLPVPRVIPGDTGAMFFGLMLGVLTIYAGGKVATGFLVLGVPLVDSFIVVTRRMFSGRSPLRGSRSGEHLHHRLLECGWSPWWVIALTTGLGTVFGITALFLSTFGKFLAALGVTILIISLALWSGHYARSAKR